MNFLTAVNHLLNFVLPALAVAVILVAGSRLVLWKKAKASGWLAPIALLFVVGCGVQVLGLVLLGHDGHLLTYAALVLVSASTHWLWLRAWR